MKTLELKHQIRTRAGKHYHFRFLVEEDIKKLHEMLQELVKQQIKWEDEVTIECTLSFRYANKSNI